MDFKIKSPQNIGRFPKEEAAKKLVFDAKWGADTAPPNTVVEIKAASRVAIEGTTAEVKIYQLLDGREIPVEIKNVPLTGGKVETEWRTKPVKAGNFEAGIYHFKVTVGGYSGETVVGLKLKDEVRRNESSFETANSTMPKLVLY